MANEPDHDKFIEYCETGDLKSLKKLYKPIQNGDQKKPISERYVNANWEGFHPLMAAVYYKKSYKNMELIKWLIETCGADPNIYDNWKQSYQNTLHWAIENESESVNIELIKYLLDVNVSRTFDKNSLANCIPVTFTIEKNKTPRKGKELTLESINRRGGRYGWTPLDLAHKVYSSDPYRDELITILHSPAVGGLAYFHDKDGDSTKGGEGESKTSLESNMIVVPKYLPLKL